ncbi:MAG: choice-of-anchor D domain-containing protein [Myxococcota bacterium]|nr:choice-of-anchor D domain-containing protein [Myxococcota bacterium]
MISFIPMLFGCSDNTKVNVIYPDMAIATENIDFGEVKVDETETYTLQIINAGAASLRIGDIALSDDLPVYSLNPTALEIPSSEVAEVEISFTPTDFTEYNTALNITSNDEENPNFSLPLLGYGGDGPTPDIFVDAESLDFGDVAVGEEGMLYFTVRNQGDAELTIGSTLQSGSGAFSLVGDLDEQLLAPGVETGIVVNYVPFHDAGDSGALTIFSNDPEEPQVDVQFIGNGGGEDNYPVAAIACPSTVQSPSDLFLDGTNSTDPTGQVLNYQWTLERSPLGSQAILETPNDSQTNLNVDVSGNYQVNLIVQNANGTTSPPAECLFYAEPPADIHIELSWLDADADLDLHLMQEENALFSLESDCCWCNSNPEWGESIIEDNPVLSVDSSDNSTPEMLDVWQAETKDYYLSTHYFSDLGAGQTEATIRIYLSGVLVGQYSQTMIHNQVWDVGFIRWSTNHFIENSSPPYAYEGLRSCH